MCSPATLRPPPLWSGRRSGIVYRSRLRSVGILKSKLEIRLGLLLGGDKIGLIQLNQHVACIDMLVIGGIDTCHRSIDSRAHRNNASLDRRIVGAFSGPEFNKPSNTVRTADGQDDDHQNQRKPWSTLRGPFPRNILLRCFFIVVIVITLTCFRLSGSWRLFSGFRFDQNLVFQSLLQLRLPSPLFPLLDRIPSLRESLCGSPTPVFCEPSAFPP